MSAVGPQNVGAGAAPHRVVIVGGGFGGLYAAQGLAKAEVDITLVDRRNFHLFQPLLYQVATGGLSPGDICSPLRRVLKKQKNVRVILGDVTDVDVGGREVLLTDGRVPYDTLIVATGASHSYFGHDAWQVHAPGLKTVEEAIDIRRRIFLAFETAEREPDRLRRDSWLTFVVVGAGPTGVELAGALGEIANEVLRGDFRRVQPSDARIVLIELQDQVLPGYPPGLAAKAKAALEGLGVTVRLETSVTSIDGEAVTVKSKGAAGEERILTRTVVWAAGVQANELGRKLAAGAGVDTDRSGRLIVEPDLSLPGHAEILIVGDLAHFDQEKQALPGVAPVAMAQGRYAADLVCRRLAGRVTKHFRYRDKGTMATIGRSKAVVNLGRLHFSGLFAWVTWLFIHLLYLVEFQNRLLVLIQWGWNFLTLSRGSRLITGASPLPLPLSDAATAKGEREQRRSHAG
jgi:NADH dehydrogenase